MKTRAKKSRASVSVRRDPTLEDKRPATKCRTKSPANRRTALHPFGTWNSKPSVTQREARQLAEMGITLRPGIERDTLLMPWVIAESVLHEASAFLDVQLPFEWVDWLDQRAERCYARHPQFRYLVRKEKDGRGYLYAFFRHWLAGKLHKTNVGLYRQLPRNYLLGAPLLSRRNASGKAQLINPSRNRP